MPRKVDLKLTKKEKKDRNSVNNIPDLKIPVPKLFAPGDYGFQPCSFHDATAQMKKDAAGGCGPGGRGDKYVPDTMYGLRITPSCAIHDWMYFYGETPAQKIRADDAFLNNMHRQIEAQAIFRIEPIPILKKLSSFSIRIVKRLRMIRARTYYLAVHYGGGPSFYENVNKPEEMR